MSDLNKAIRDPMKPFLDLILEHATYAQGNLKHVGLKAVNPDFTTRGGFRWAFPGKWTRDPVDTGSYSTEVCPTGPGDGLSVAKTVSGMAQGSYRPVTVLVVGFSGADLIAEDDNKWKVRKAKTLAVVDGVGIIRTFGSRADLAGADLSGHDKADLKARGATL